MSRYSSIFCLFFIVSSSAYAQQTGHLTVDKIMRDPKWMGVSPDNLQWKENSKTLYFTWDPEATGDSDTWQITTGNYTPERVPKSIQKNNFRGQPVYSKDRKKILFERNGDVILKTVNEGRELFLTNTVEQETGAVFSADEQRVIFQRGENLYSISVAGGGLTQLTNFTRTRKRSEIPLNRQDQWLKNDQLREFQIIRKREENRKENELERKENEPVRPKEFYLDDKSSLSYQRLSPDGRYLVFRIMKRVEGNKNTIIPNFVTESGYTEDINGRTKVGNMLPSYESYIVDYEKDTVIRIATKDIPGIRDLPDYLNDYPKEKAEREKKNADREVSIGAPIWNESGTKAFLVVVALDNKDRWIMQLDMESAKLSLLDRQRDEAWIGGPGIGGAFGSGNAGWLDENTIYFQSEASGYSHLYTMDVRTRRKNQLTSGKYEVQSLRLSNDKRSFYFSANIEHPGITHYYQIRVSGGNPVKLTSMKGGNEVRLSPDEKWLAIRHSYLNRPWELYVQENKAGATAKKITSSQSDEFKSYPWREPDMVSFKNRYGNDVYARVYRPATPHPSRPAVVFVHGAGYLQNVHYWWSQYFREYMFNNLLADQGYTVIDIDYTASSGYGRDHRTGIYRHMGGKDLTDHVDGVRFLVDNYGVNPANVGLYGGSYGGFITLMGLFTQPEIFKSGAALRSVTDWAHYNHGYTSNILNEPNTDSIAYRRSSPLYFANGFRGHLLMAHGMVDVNVHFQDIVRLSQKLIELGKENWELAVYPVEDHAFTEASSWTDEYKRVLKLFDNTLKK